MRKTPKKTNKSNKPPVMMSKQLAMNRERLKLLHVKQLKVKQNRLRIKLLRKKTKTYLKQLSKIKPSSKLKVVVTLMIAIGNPLRKISHMLNWKSC